MSQFAYGLAPFINVPVAEAAAVCVNDTAGANDEPGQKDLTRLCEDNAPPAGMEIVSWNWDDKGTSGGGQSLDACGLFDSDGDGFINYSICVTTQNDPAVIDTVTIYECTADSRIDRCGGPSKITGTYDTTCTVTQTNTDPFPTGNFSPLDTTASCNFDLDDLPVSISNLVLTDVCSYPSREPNSDPSDCVIIQTNPVALIEVIKDIVPNGAGGLFNLTIDGPAADDTTTVSNVGDGGTTGAVSVSPPNNGGTAIVSETAGTNTNLANYSSSISCVDRGTTNVVASGSGTSLQVPVSDGDNIVCTITNTAFGSITIVKDAIPDSTQDFGFTSNAAGFANFALDDEAGANTDSVPESVTIPNLAAGTYTFTEAQVAGWYLDQIDCPDITETQNVADGTVSLTITAGQNITCTFTNRQLGQIIVTKQTNPDNDPTQFSIAATPAGGVVSATSPTISDNGSVTYVVKHGTFAVNETVPAGWTMTSNTCSDLVIDGNTPLVNGVPTRTCAIVNTKLAKLKIIKDALPNGPQDFAFTTTGTGLFGFILDDDAVDVERSNEQQFVDLAPNQQYTVTEGDVAGWDLTSAICSTSSSLNNKTLSITLLAGDDVTCTFTNTQRGSISGIKFNDVDGDGVFDPGEPVLSNWNIFIDTNNNGILDNGELSALTNDQGLYIFSNLVPDTYTLAEVLLNGWTQTVAPAPVVLDPGETSTGNNFGNFQHGSVSGTKFNDHNGNGVRDQGDEGLQNWTIQVFNDNDDPDNLLNNLFLSTTTDANGNYSFTNQLPAGTYNICEVQQINWIQTFPANNGCHLVTIDVSGESNSGKDFGNQGRGNVVVIKNVDSDGDGDIDFQDVTNWNWNLDGQGNFTTGSTNVQNVAAGNYTVGEVQQANFHVTASSCSGETPPQSPSEQIAVNVSVGETVTCTFVNTRDTGTITVRKLVNPTNDTGLFDLNISGVTYGDDVSHGEGTGTILLPTGTYNVSETAGTGTNLSDYSSSFECNNQLSGQTTTTPNFTLSTGQDVVCVFTNTRLGHIIIQKETLPDGDPQVFNFTASYDNDGFSLSDGQSNNSGNLLPGTYSVAETVPEGWDLTGATCDDESDLTSIDLSAGETVTCTFTNTKRANVIVTKYNDVNQNGEQDADELTLPGWEITLDNTEDDIVGTTQLTGLDGSTTFANTIPGSYSLSENLASQQGWNFSDIDCSGGEQGGLDGETFFLSADPGETVTCAIGNFPDAALNITKANNRPTPTTVGDTVTYTLTVSVPDDAGAVFGATVQDLPPKNFDYIPGSWTAVSSERGDIKAEGTTTEPTYGSPGAWILGNLLPGEVVTLTYQAKIASSVISGSYPDIAFTQGCENSTGDCEVVLGNVSTGANSPFVRTAVAVATPQVLGANTTVLVETGQKLQQALITTISLILLGTSMLVVFRPKKGGQL